MVVGVMVGVAIRRPPSPANTRYVWVVVQADNETQARLIACLMALVTIHDPEIPHVCMPVSAVIQEIYEL